MNVFSRDPFKEEPGLMRRLADLPLGVRWGTLVVTLIALIFVGWLGFEILGAKSHLEQARNDAQQTKDALLAGKSPEATQWAQHAQINARKAQAATHSWPWTIAAAVPLFGSPLKTTQQMSDVVVGLADDVLLPATKIGTSISPDRLVEGNRINLALLREEQPQLSELAAAAAKLDNQSQAISRPTYPSLVGSARLQLQDQTAKLASMLHYSALAGQVAPSMLGADGPRTYLMAFQTPAEARGTGGLLGGFGVLRFDNGVPKVDALGSNTELGEAEATVDLGPEFNKVYGWMNPYTDFRNSNLSPHFPYAAQIWKSMWEGQAKSKLDGVIGIDPVALSYLLGALGPLKMPDGEIITDRNVVELTLSTAYARFPPQFTYFPNGDRLTRDDARKKFLQEIASQVVKKLAGPLQSPRKLLDALGRAASERRIAVWSANSTDQELLDATPLGHTVPDDNPPYAQVVINNLAGNKMDYYLKREIEYAADGCEGATRNSTVTVRLTNTAPPDTPLPEYVSGTPGLRGLPLNAPPGTMVSSVRVFTTKGSRLLSVTSNGERTSVIEHVERGHPTFELRIAIPPGRSGELVFRLIEPTSPGDPLVPIQPLVDNVSPSIAVPACH